MNFAEEMKNLTIQVQKQVQKAEAAREHKEDVDNGKILLRELPKYIRQQATKGFSSCDLVLTHKEIYFGYFLFPLSLGIKFNDKNYFIELSDTGIKFNDKNYFITKIQEYCEANGFEMVVGKFNSEDVIEISW